jgi:hypothetical protein
MLFSWASSFIITWLGVLTQKIKENTHNCEYMEFMALKCNVGSTIWMKSYAKKLSPGT